MPKSNLEELLALPSETKAMYKPESGVYMIHQNVLDELLQRIKNKDFNIISRKITKGGHIVELVINHHLRKQIKTTTLAYCVKEKLDKYMVIIKEKFNG